MLVFEDKSDNDQDAMTWILPVSSLCYSVEDSATNTVGCQISG